MASGRGAVHLEKQTVELRITGPLRPAGAIRAARRFLRAAGVPSAEIVECVDEKSRHCVWYPPLRETARRLRDHLVPVLPAPLTVAIHCLRTSAWQTKWQKDFKPFYLTERTRVVPVWFKTRVAATADDVLIDPGMAFGTGLHPTTSAIAGFIAGLKGTFSKFLDVGTGTGILSIVAARNGARTIWAVDVSPDSVKAARHNFRLNDCRCGYTAAVDFGAFDRPGRFDLVAANILAEPLVAWRDKLCARVLPGGHLAVSDIWHEAETRFRRRFESPAIAPVSVVKKDGWVAILYRRSQS